MSHHEDDHEESNPVVPQDIELPLSPPPQSRPAPLKIPKPSRLPVPRKVSSPLPSPTTPGLRSQPSRDRLGSHGDGKNIQDSMHHSISRRPSKLRLVERVDPEDAQGDDGDSYSHGTASSLAKSTPRKKPSTLSLSGGASPAIRPTGSPAPSPALKPRASSSQLPSKPSINTRKSSSTLLTSSPLQSPMSSPRVGNRRTSDIYSAGSPSLQRKPSGASLKQPTPTINKRQSLQQLSSRGSPALGAPTDSASPLRRLSSSTLPAAPKVTVPAPKPAARAPAKKVAPKAPRPDSVASSADLESPAKKQSLRDTIRQARAAKQRADSVMGGDTPVSAHDSFDFNTEDPFNQNFGVGGMVKVLQQRIKSARADGRLNISALELAEIPEAVWKMYDTTEEELNDDGDGPKWYENVDLTKIIAADNEITEIGEMLATVFGALNSIDIHNNLLTSLPSNLSQLSELTHLNLSGNKLTNSALEVLFSISSLKDLKLSKNLFTDDLSEQISQLTSLESLDLHENKLTSLPSSISSCTHLRHLDLSHNCISSLPLAELSSCPISDLDVSHNKLSGTFFPENVNSLPHLAELNISSNQITLFSATTIVLPQLKQLLANNNQLSDIPDVTGWIELLVLLVDQNKVSLLPESLFGLGKLRTLDFSGNSVKIIDPRLGAMDSLEVINFQGNPLIDRKLAGMHATDLKKTLSQRLAPPEIVVDAADDGEVIVGGDEVQEVASKAIEVGRGGVLDLANKNLTTLDGDLLDNLIGSPYTILLAHNSLTIFPTIIDRFASLSSLDLSSNRLVADYLTDKVMLRSLETLNLHNTGLASLSPLFQYLEAPKLQTLDISANRIPSIEGLRQAFPNLLHLHAANNCVEEIPIESVDGVRVLDLTGNSIGSLPPRLATCEGLRELRVQGNLFRDHLIPDDSLSSLPCSSLDRVLNSGEGAFEYQFPEGLVCDVVSEIPSELVSDTLKDSQCELSSDAPCGPPRKFRPEISIEIVVESSNGADGELDSGLGAELPTLLLTGAEEEDGREIFVDSPDDIPLEHHYGSDGSEDSSEFEEHPTEIPKGLPLLLLSDTEGGFPSEIHVDSPNSPDSPDGFLFHYGSELLDESSEFEEHPIVLVEEVPSESEVLKEVSNEISRSRQSLGRAPSGLSIKLQEDLEVVEVDYDTQSEAPSDIPEEVLPRWQVLEKGTDAVMAWLRDRLPAEGQSGEDFDEETEN
ncbi:Similar to Leucine-rich repeat-containing protein 40; acc. no. Q6GPJ5 [Pyronema omphalodes CBS 100304]|uniref:Similar to Leucine-rich repeat-containing protein 40 acc. no. Q6GPJ5 n=1 Tax=Pyronema omphalodes (strain CBS 100304) TaxID=1076935 RepID=U4LPR7_PYROM|nr:Similar to Leucine-rich repeat-containing protein 40; acc. no. Q6GPJ5 [Pyronema omphalodes CBS 100304]